MEDIRVDGKLQRVFVLRKTDESIVYIPLNSLTYVDYKRLLDVEAQGGEMLTQMRKVEFDNGRNALALYDNVIEVVRLSGKKNEGNRVLKPGEHNPQPTQQSSASVETSKEEKKEAPKKRGRPPAAKKEGTSKSAKS